MTFVSILISLKTSNVIENKSQVFERSDCTITVHNDLYYNELEIQIKLSRDKIYHIKSKSFK